MNKVSIEKIAKEMHLAKSTVSVALSNKYGVSESLRSEIVLKAIEMGYDFSKINKRNRVDVVIAHSDLLVKSLFWSEVLKGIEKHFNDNKININFIVMSEIGDKILEEIIGSKAKAVVFVNPKAKLLEYAKLVCVPVVILDAFDNVCFDFDHILADNFSGGYQVAKYLYENGHRNIGILGNCDYSYSFTQRRAGFDYFFHNLDTTDYNIYHENRTNKIDLYDIEFGRKLLSEKLVTAIMCLNDPIAIRFKSAIDEFNLNVCDDISIIGFDDDSSLTKFFPNLTTIRVSKTEMGKVAAASILDRINEKDRPVQCIAVAVKIIKRSSVKNIAKSDKGEDI